MAGSPNNPALSPDASVFVVAQSNTASYNTYGLVASSQPNGFILHPSIGSDVGAFTTDSNGTYFGAGAVSITSTLRRCTSSRSRGSGR